MTSVRGSTGSSAAIVAIAYLLPHSREPFTIALMLDPGRTGAELLRRIAEEGTPPATVRLVNWADEEGARFGRSLFGSSAAAGSMADQEELRERKDADGVALPEAIERFGVDLDTALDAKSELETAAAYLELHIEQGPVLESMDLQLGVVLGTFGV